MVTARGTAEQAAQRLGGAVFLAGLLAFVAVALPVVWRGAPLADDFNNCLAPEQFGLGGFLAMSWERLGIVRLARFPEILLTLGVCRRLPFGIAIVVPAALTIAVAFLARRLLRDLGTPAPWADVGGAVWLLQPLGTEAALWPAALHVPLGLVFSLLALHLYRQGRYSWAVVASLGAAMSIEQSILALPFAAWLVVPAEQRRRAVRVGCITALVVLLAFLAWPGSDVRLRAGLADRITSLAVDPVFYVAFPAVGLGVHSIPLAVQWALPWSIPVLAAGIALGIVACRRLPDAPGFAMPETARWIGAAVILLALTNAPVLLNVPRQGSPRVFAPTWLLLAVVSAAMAARIRWRRPLLLGAAAGVLAAGALLSMVFSVSVRLATADFTERSAHWLASQLPDGANVAVCGVRRTVVMPAPRGAFAVHEFIYDWAPRRALDYYTGRQATFQVAGGLWPDQPCPDPSTVDAVIQFDELVEASRE